MADEKEIEMLCRVICKAEGVDPDKIGLGCGDLMPKDEKYPLWQARRRTAKAILDAGYVWIPHCST